MTVLEVIQKSAEFLAKKRVESPRLQTELLLAHVLRLPRMELYLNFERVLSDPELGTAMGEYGRHLSETRHTWAALAGRILSVTEGVRA